MERRQFILGTGAVAAAVIVAPKASWTQTDQVPLSATRAELLAARRLDGRQRTMIVDTAINVIQEVYVHRAMKAALYGVDVVAQLRALRTRAAMMDDASFHRQMRRAFAQLHDRHASYSDGLGSKKFTLGITIGRAFEGDVAKFFVTGSNTPMVPVGSQARHWNAIPLERVIDELAEDIGAGNETSRKAVARRYLTQRPSAKFDIPAEDWVRLDIVDPSGASREVQLSWSVAEPRVAALAPSDDEDERDEEGLDEDYLLTESPPHKLFRQRQARATPPIVWADTIQVEGRSFGYLRFEHFKPRSLRNFLMEVQALLRSLPTTGLVIDVRGNPGGNIPAGEMVVQFLTNRRITPHGFRFRASNTTEIITERNNSYRRWHQTVSQGRLLGAEHSADFPINTSDYNEFGRVYPGPSVLLVDAITYSTADMFASSYHYHGVGEVICTDENIGAGGANVWTYSVLLDNLPAFLVAASHQSDLDQGKVSTDLVAEFAQHGRRISAAAQVREGQRGRSQKTWLLTEGDTTYRLIKTPSRSRLAVYYPGAHPQYPELPRKISFRFSVRQAIRKGNASGMILEDAGLVPDHLYKITKDDLLDGDKDLLAFACSRFPK